LFRIEEKCLGDWRYCLRFVIIVSVIVLAAFLLVRASPWPVGVGSGLGTVGVAIRKVKNSKERQ
jgi:hypothetical protein